MKSFHTFFAFFLGIFISVVSIAQEREPFYATMALQDAEELFHDLPSEIEILDRFRNEAVVRLTDKGAHAIHERVLVHGPGYIYKANYEDAVADIRDQPVKRPQLLPFTITEDDLVAEALTAIQTQNIEDHILELEGYGTRYHTKSSSIDAANDLKVRWETMASDYGRDDVSVRLFNHAATAMPSVIMTIEGADQPDDLVIVGGHLDSTANPSDNNAPGADDDASGIATMTETVRALFEIGFQPQKTIEVMAYAAEEIGLVGSAEIADEYNDTNKNVIAVCQFDMTNYQGSANDVYFITDFTSASLNAYLMDLMDHYNASGDHVISYGTSVCNYGCSDHASWTNEGFMAAFPFESSFGQHNPNIHSSNDTYNFVSTATHATKFAKLCAEYLIETAKGVEEMSVSEAVKNDYELYLKNRSLVYRNLTPRHPISKITVFDSQGKAVHRYEISEQQGIISLETLANGIYIVQLEIADKGIINKKVTLN